MRRLFALVVVLLALALAAPTVGAQDASPEAGPCDAPELPPGTATPIEEGTPGAEAEAEEETPAEEAEGEPPAPPAGTPAAAEDADAAAAGLENIINCINAGEFLSVAAVMTENFRVNFLGIPNPYDVPADFEDVQPVDIRLVDNAQTYADGSVSVDAVFTGLFNGPGQVGSARWTFVEEDGYQKLDNYQDVPLPEGALPGATVIDVQMVDFAFALSEYTVPANTPVVFRTTNNSGTDSPHENVILTFTEGTTAEQVIEGEVNIDEASTGFFGAVFLEPGATGDVGFESLAPGTYFLVCGVETEDGTPHFELGMVTQITVE